MTGAECLLETLAANGIEHCFMNPGTSEMRFVAALDSVPQVRGVLCLYEGVCSGAADGYARMTGRPAATLLHLGPGLANALSNLHNARKARSPVVNIVGEHSTRHMQYDAPLSADIEAFARPVSAAIRTVRDAAEMGSAAAGAIAAAIQPPGQISTLIVPADFSWSPAGPVRAAGVTYRNPGCRAMKPCARPRGLLRRAGRGHPARRARRRRARSGGGRAPARAPGRAGVCGPQHAAHSRRSRTVPAAGGAVFSGSRAGAAGADRGT